MQYYDINTNPSGRARILAAGRYFLYYEGSAGGADSALLIRTGNSGTGVILRPGQAYRIPPELKTPDEWNVSPLVAGAQVVGRVVIGDGRIDDGRISGAVEVIDGGRARTLAGVAFVGWASSAASVGNLSHNQLWNPAGSGRNLVVEQVIISSNVTGTPGVRFHNAALTTLVGSAVSKRSSGAASNAQIRTQASAVLLGGNTIAGCVIPAAGQFMFVPREPIIVEPGAGLIVVHSALNADIATSFEFYEEGV